MTEHPTPTNEIELPPLPRIPWATMATALLILFLFVVLVGAVLEYSRELGPQSEDPARAERQLLDLRAAERERLESDGYDAQTKSFNIPIERAMTILIEEGNASVELRQFPAPKQEAK